MNIKPYFWDLSEAALAETERILRDPAHPKFARRMVTLLSRCDKPKDVFSLIDKKQFAEAWPKIRKEWKRTNQASDFRDWWETVYEGLLEEKNMKRVPAGLASTKLRLIGERIKMARVLKGWSQEDLATRVKLKQTDISAIENGRKNFTFETLERLNVVLSSELIVIPPPEWPGDSLSAFIERTERNIFYPFVHLKGLYSVFVKIDAIFYSLFADEKVTKYKTAGEMLLRLFGFSSHSAYRAACRLSLSGQVGEAHMVLRGCLENSLYALHIYHHPETHITWLKRNDDKESEDSCRSEFSGKGILRTLKDVDQDLHTATDKLYNRVIDFGAHPNVFGMVSRLAEGEGTQGKMKFVYVADDMPESKDIYRHGLKTTAQVGISSLKILEHIFRNDFKRLGLDNEIGILVSKAGL